MGSKIPARSSAACSPGKPRAAAWKKPRLNPRRNNLEISCENEKALQPERLQSLLHFVRLNVGDSGRQR
jgi:hypothetical protein